jgi:hypothetical protein
MELLFTVDKAEKYSNYPPSFTPFNSTTYFGSSGGLNLDKIRQIVDPQGIFVDPYDSRISRGLHSKSGSSSGNHLTYLSLIYIYILFISLFLM